jgi:hypothetical protein
VEENIYFLCENCYSGAQNSDEGTDIRRCDHCDYHHYGNKETSREEKWTSKKNSRVLSHATHPAFYSEDCGNLRNTSVMTGGVPGEIGTGLSPEFKMKQKSYCRLSTRHKSFNIFKSQIYVHNSRPS